MYKLCGGIIVISAFIFAGFSKVFEMNKRLRALKAFKQMFEDLKFEMNFKGTELPVATRKIGLKHNNKCFVDWGEEMHRTNAEDSFNQQLKLNQNKFNLLECDIEVLKYAVASLGRLDLKSQLTRLETGISEIDSQIRIINDTKAEKTRLFISGYFLTGLFVVLMLS